MTPQDSARPTQSNTLRQGLHRSPDPEPSESTHEASFPARRMDNQLKWGKALWHLWPPISDRVHCRAS